MKRTLTSATLLAAAISCNAAEAGAPDADQTAIAQNAVKTLGTALKAELGKAMQSGGPVAAIGVCSTQALPITRKVGAEQGVEIGRVSLKNRNPANAPNDWQTQVLEGFEQRRAEGADLASLHWSETVETGEGREFRYMQPIPTAGICLTCHGTQLAPAVSEALAEAYPNDRATGFSEGDIRGAFVVTRKLPD